MSDLPGVVITGVSGRMGRMLVHEVAASETLRVSGAIERSGHDWVGRDLGAAMGGAETGVIVTDDAEAAFADAAAVIDFTAPEATIAFGRLAAARGLVHVIGTTGFTEDQIASLEEVSKGAVQVRAGNMSLGVNLLTVLTRQVAAALYADFDIEVVAAHHNDGITGVRKRGDIGFSAIRGGDIVGEHDVIFAGAGERIVLRHIASDRSLFAKGALKAVRWGQGQAPGFYDMLDVLGLN